MAIREKLEQYHENILLESFSEVLWDAITLTVSLNIEYIWIDWLCIVQHDAASWESESPRMYVIYGNATVVFAAHGGALGLEKRGSTSLHDPIKPQDPSVFCRVKIDHSALFPGPDDSSSWWGRAWCMQETFFARRMVHFAGLYEEIFFECNTHAKCECGRIPDERTLKAIYASSLQPGGNRDAPIDRDELWKVYISACEDYSARGLAYPTDKMPAVSILMSSLSPHLGRYYASLWEHNLPMSLQWEAYSTLESSRYQEYVAPSFSWASRSDTVVWYDTFSKIPNAKTHDFARL